MEFVLAETRGHWHNRARALICRRLKHCDLSPDQGQKIAACIIGRLRDGNFTEQFRDQLRLAIHIDAARTLEAARECLEESKEYVRRFAAWTMNNIEQREKCARR